ncbi:acyl-CoA N-acyltransferase [Hypoxylon fuscum]|nr:acyl-CoA N-acyltransferase [Hypoxylon fuscum]
MATAKVASIAAASQPLSKPVHEVIIGDAMISDAAAIAMIGANTFTAAFGFSVPAKDLADFLKETYSVEAVEAEILNAQATNISTFVARDEAGKVLGFVQMVRGLSDPCLHGDAVTHAELRRLYVDTTAHGRGIGSKLIAAVEDKAKAEGFSQLWLTVWEENGSAQRLYQRLGYVKAGEADFATGGCIQTDWVLAKSTKYI